MVRWKLFAGIAVVCSALALAPAAEANTGDTIAPQNSPPTAADGWQAGTCSADPCSPTTPNLFYTQAAGHPATGFTQFIVKHTTVVENVSETPSATLKDVRVDLPAGLSVNPQATPQCALADFEKGIANCPLTSVVGQSAVTVSALGLVSPPLAGVTLVPVYNLIPAQGEPALFGFNVAGQNVYLKSDVDWSGDYHEGFTIAVPESPLGTILKNRLVFTGTAGNGTFLTQPSTCHNPAQAPFQHIYSTFLRADSKESPNPSFPSGSASFEGALPPGVKPDGCNNVPFKPGVATDPGTNATDSPAPAEVSVTVPFDAGAAIANSNVRTATVSLPTGMGLNPSSAGTLAFCEDAQLGKGTRKAVTCPAKSKIGTATIETPPLPAGSLTGSVFLGKQLSRDPASGKEYRIFVDVESARFGVSVRLIGEVSANPKTGQLTTTLAENPQLPFSAFKLKFNGGAGAVLTSPPTCGPNTTSGLLTPYSETAAAKPAGSFNLAKAPGGGNCAKTMAARPFAPVFSTASKSIVAGAFSPLSLHVGRNDGNQELKGIDVTLPPGISGKLVGIPYCSAKALAQAAARAGATEAKSSSCPDKSLVGAATIKAGTGASPLQIKGDVFLSGPYRGAPLSLAVITPAVAGPFDLGTVVVRVALFVDPETAQIHPVSDPIPDVYGGAKLDIRSIDVNASRKEFVINPTSCGKLATAGSLLGGGANPAAPPFSSFAVSAPFQTTNCGALKFRPKLVTRIFGGKKQTHRAKNPKFRAILTGRDGDANLASAAVTLPKAMILDQSHIKTICTRPQLAANQCPSSSIYGQATATSPLLGDPLSGPVYLVPGNKILPDLLVDLQGQVDIRLRGTTDTVKGRLRNSFSATPDVPVSKFVLTLYGGKRGLLINTRSLCKRKLSSKVVIKGQNGKKLGNKKTKLKVPACKKKGKGKKGGKKRG